MIAYSGNNLITWLYKMLRRKPCNSIVFRRKIPTSVLHILFTLYTPNIFIGFGPIHSYVGNSLVFIGTDPFNVKPDNPFCRCIMHANTAWGLCIYGSSDHFHKQHFRSGFDDALIWVSNQFV